MVAMPHRPNIVSLIDPDKATLIDVRSKKLSKTIPKWGGICTRDGKYGLYAPTRCVICILTFILR